MYVRDSVYWRGSSGTSETPKVRRSSQKHAIETVGSGRIERATTEYEDYWTSELHPTDLGLSRYVDAMGEGCGTVPDTPHHRALAELGWDNTARFDNDSSRVLTDANPQSGRNW